MYDFSGNCNMIRFAVDFYPQLVFIKNNELM